MRGARGGAAHAAAVTCAAIAWFAGSARLAHGEDAVNDAGSDASDGFACASEAQAFVQDHGVAEIRIERDRRLAARADRDEPPVGAAHHWCVAAELMRSLGDASAATLYRRAIAATGDPGYELRLADYFRIARGPHAALIEQAEQHYRAALAGVRAHAAAPGASDDAIAERATRGLMLARQQDGVTLLPWSESPHDRGAGWPSIALMVGGRIAFDTNDTPVDLSSPPEVDDARRFTSEAMFAASMFRKAQPLRLDELQAIARAPRRDQILARGRIRAWPIGALDVWYRQSQIHAGQITDYQRPDQRNDLALSELGAGVTRALDLAAAFDVLLAGGYRRVHRIGGIESAPEQAQDFDMFELRPAVARFVGPDKLSLAGSYAILAIPDVAGGVVANRARGRTIASLDVDYAWNRLALAPLRLPRLQFFAGVAQDDEMFGVRMVRRRDAHLGVAAPGMRGWELTIQAALFTGAVEVQPLDPAQLSSEDPEQSNAQYRTTVSLLRRLIDEDARPGLPPETAGVRPSLVNAVVTVRHDLALRGLPAFQNVRGGLELSAKVFVTGLRGTAVLTSAGYDNQYFYSIRKDLHVFHLDMRMGW